MKKFLFTSLILLFVLFSTNAQTLKVAIAKIGCTKIQTSKIKPMSLSDEELKIWLKSFKIQSKTSFVAKCGGYRYLFEEEVFVDEMDAKARLPKINELPSYKEDKSDFGVPIILREGFSVNNKIYTVGAFAAFLADEGYVKKYKNKLAKQIK